MKLSAHILSNMAVSENGVYIVFYHIIPPNPPHIYVHQKADNDNQRELNHQTWSFQVPSHRSIYLQ